MVQAAAERGRYRSASSHDALSRDFPLADAVATFMRLKTASLACAQVREDGVDAAVLCRTAG